MKLEKRKLWSWKTRTTVKAICVMLAKAVFGPIASIIAYAIHCGNACVIAS